MVLIIFHKHCKKKKKKKIPTYPTYFFSNVSLNTFFFARVLTRILKVGVRDSLFIKSRSPSQKVGVPLPKNRSPIFLFFHDSPLIVSMSQLTSFC